jgi:hypothetical protein
MVSTTSSRDAFAAKQLKRCAAGYGIHWPDIDEHLSTDGLLRGAPSPEVRKSEQIE